MTGSEFLLGDGGPELRICGPLAAVLWPAVRDHARELETRGATERLRRLLPLLSAWQTVAAEADLRRAGGFRSEAREGTADPLAADFLRDPGDWLSATQAAAALGCSRQWITSLARRGEIEAQRIGERWVISPAAVIEVREQRERSGGSGPAAAGRAC